MNPDIDVAEEIKEKDKKEHEILSKYKIILLGDEHVGKTAILKQFVYQTFDECYKSTIGVEFLSKVLNINGQESRFQIWDTAGQARFRALIPSYLGGAHVAIIVYDLTNSTSFENIPEWIDLVQKCGEKFSLVVLLGNKLDLEDKREVSWENANQLSLDHQISFMEISAKTGANVDKIFSQIAQLSSSSMEV